MNKFVMTEELDNVKNKKVQALLKEVISCYSNGNYRAAIVTVYTTMIYDLLIEKQYKEFGILLY